MNFSCVFAQQDEIILQSNFVENVIAMSENSSQKVALPKLDSAYLESQEKPNISADDLNNSVTSGSGYNQLQQRSRFYNSITKTANDVYKLQIEDTSKPASLFEDLTTFKYESGPIEKLHIWAVTQPNSNIDISDGGDVSSNFGVGILNILFDGTMRGGKETFRINVDPSHQGGRPFFKQFLLDAYVESKRIPNHTLRVGHYRTGVGIEGGQSSFTLPLVNRSQISRNFGNSRKMGARIKGNYSLVDYELGGYSSDTFFTEFLPGAEFTGWVNFKPLGKTDGKYGKLTTGGGIVAGERNSTDYLVSGAYVGYEYKKFWTRMEYANADGSNGGSGLTSKKRQGWYVTLGYKITQKLEAILRYDEFDPDKRISNNNQREYTAGINYYIKGQALKIMLNYVFCQNENRPDSHRILIGTQIAL